MNAHLVDVPWLAAHLADALVVDCRFTGARDIPGAILLPWNELVDATGRFCSPADIRRRAAEAGLHPVAETVTYCQGGVRAAHTALALRLAGFERVRVYDGSWAQWGNDPALPVAVPESHADRG